MPWFRCCFQCPVTTISSGLWSSISLSVTPHPTVTTTPQPLPMCCLPKRGGLRVHGAHIDRFQSLMVQLHHGEYLGNGKHTMQSKIIGKRLLENARTAGRGKLRREIRVPISNNYARLSTPRRTDRQTAPLSGSIKPVLESTPQFPKHTIVTF